MTSDHLRPLLSDLPGMKLLFQLGENLSRGHVPRVVVDLVRAGRMTALKKSDGGVRGIVAGDVVRRLFARTMSQQLGPATMRLHLTSLRCRHVQDANVSHTCCKV